MRSGVDHTVLPANHTTPAFTRSSSGGATTEWTVIAPADEAYYLLTFILAVILPFISQVEAPLVQQPYLPDKTKLPYQLRKRSHNMTLINKTNFLTILTYFIVRMLYKYSY